MELTYAKEIADRPHMFPSRAIRLAALERLTVSRKFIGRHSTDRAIDKLDERIERLDTALRVDAQIQAGEIFIAAPR